MVIYVAMVEREGQIWTATVEGLSGAHAYGSSLKQLREDLADAIVLSAGLDDDAKIDVVLQLSEPEKSEVLAEAFAAAERRRRHAREKADIIAEAARLARSLLNAGWSTREAADALGITSGRVSQLIRGDQR